MMNAGVVDQEVQRQAVERQPGRPAPDQISGAGNSKIARRFGPSFSGPANSELPHDNDTVCLLRINDCT